MKRSSSNTETANKWVVCVKPFVAEGGRLVSRLGDEMRSDDPRVQLCPEAFVPLGTLRSQWPQPRSGGY
jgi:hypothetical protein